MIEIQALTLSAAIEAPVAALVVRLIGWPSRGPWQVGLAAAVATAVSHPQLWAFVLWAASHGLYGPAAGLGEVLVVLGEAALIAWMAHLPLRRALVVSLLANAASCGAGLLFSL